MDKCTDCKGDLEKGVLLDQTYGAITAGRYAKAEIPDVSSKRIFMMLESQFSDVRRIVAKRCVSCNRILYTQNTVVVSDVNWVVKKRLIIIFTIILVVLLLTIAMFFWPLIFA